MESCHITLNSIAVTTFIILCLQGTTKALPGEYVYNPEFLGTTTYYPLSRAIAKYTYSDAVLSCSSRSAKLSSDPPVHVLQLFQGYPHGIDLQVWIKSKNSGNSCQTLKVTCSKPQNNLLTGQLRCDDRDWIWERMEADCNSRKKFIVCEVSTETTTTTASTTTTSTTTSTTTTTVPTTTSSSTTATTTPALTTPTATTSAEQSSGTTNAIQSSSSSASDQTSKTPHDPTTSKGKGGGVAVVGKECVGTQCITKPLSELFMGFAFADEEHLGLILAITMGVFAVGVLFVLVCCCACKRYDDNTNKKKMVQRQQQDEERSDFEVDSTVDINEILVVDETGYELVHGYSSDGPMNDNRSRSKQSDRHTTTDDTSVDGYDLCSDTGSSLHDNSHSSRIVYPTVLPPPPLLQHQQSSLPRGRSYPSTSHYAPPPDRKYNTIGTRPHDRTPAPVYAIDNNIYASINRMNKSVGRGHYDYSRRMEEEEDQIDYPPPPPPPHQTSHTATQQALPPPPPPVHPAPPIHFSDDEPQYRRYAQSQTGTMSSYAGSYSGSAAGAGGRRKRSSSTGARRQKKRNGTRVAGPPGSKAGSTRSSRRKSNNASTIDLEATSF